MGHVDFNVNFTPLYYEAKVFIHKMLMYHSHDQIAQMDRQQAINIPNSFTKQYLSSCMSDTLGPVKITTRYGQDTNMQYYIAWTNLDRASISSMFASESGYNCTISSGIPLSTILSFIVWRAHPVLISPSNILMAKWKSDMYIHVYN